jgi:lysophospholipase L1-like esterase
MQEDPDFEYIAQPNQNRFRFRHPVYYNSHSMRSSELKIKSLRILGLGDSVINGGAHTDQDSIATTILSEKLSEELETEIQVLNISAGSWGPDNAMAYIKKQGDFDAQIAFLVASSHDAHDNMEFSKIVDKHVSFPSKQYNLAIVELIDRYIFPRFFQRKRNVNEELGINKSMMNFNTGFEDLNLYFTNKGIPFFIYLHPEKAETQIGKYNLQGEEIIKFCEIHQIELIQGINYLNINDYRDNIHLNESGQKKMASLIHDKLLMLLKEILNSGEKPEFVYE